MQREFAVRAAVLLQAIADLSSEETGIRERARLWITGESPSPEGYSFAEIADLFDLDPAAVRLAVLARRVTARGPHNLRHHRYGARPWRMERRPAARRGAA
jgi:hypothetical protein